MADQRLCDNLRAQLDDLQARETIAVLDGSVRIGDPPHAGVEARGADAGASRLPVSRVVDRGAPRFGRRCLLASTRRFASNLRGGAACPGLGLAGVGR